jgi:hypothetical protein
MWLTPLALLLAVIFFAWAACTGMSSHDTSSTPQMGSPGGSSQSSGVKLSKDQLGKMDPLAVAQVPPSVLLDAYGPNLDKWRQRVYDLTMQNPAVTPDQRATLSVPSGPKDQYTDQQAVNQVTLDVIDASIESDYGLGERELSVVYDKDLGGFSDALHAIEANETSNSHLAAMNAYVTVGPALPRPQGAFNGVDLTEYTQARLINQQFLPNSGAASFNEYGLYALVKDDQNEAWRELRRWTTADTSFAESLQALEASGSPHQ